MKIALIKGSPHGKNSFTGICTERVKRQFPEHEFIDLNVGKKILRLEKSEEYLNSIFEKIREAHAVIWTFPIYILLVPAQLVRFVELIHERGRQDVFKGKYATVVSTSANFFDHTAHQYMREVCDDLEMPFLEGFSASMIDMTNPDKKEWKDNLTGFVEDFLYHVQNEVPLDPTGNPPTKSNFSYQPTAITETPKTNDKRLVVLTDALDDEENLNSMIDVFIKTSSIPVEILNINEIDIRGGCVGCLKCMVTTECTYNDEFEQFFNSRYTPADGMIFAGTIKHRYFSSRMKQFHDRGFFNGHRPIFEGKPFAYLVSGPLRQLPNLRHIIEAHIQVGGTPGIGIVSDECTNSEGLSLRIKALAHGFQRQFDRPWIRPANYLGVGGRKIFRDLVYQFKDMMVADHEYYKDKGLYDFPNLD